MPYYRTIGEAPRHFCCFVRLLIRELSSHYSWRSLSRRVSWRMSLGADCGWDFAQDSSMEFCYNKLQFTDVSILFFWLLLWLECEGHVNFQIARMWAELFGNCGHLWGWNSPWPPAWSKKTLGPSHRGNHSSTSRWKGREAGPKFGIPFSVIKRGGFNAKIIRKIVKVWERHGNTTIYMEVLMGTSEHHLYKQCIIFHQATFDYQMVYWANCYWIWSILDEQSKMVGVPSRWPS